MPKYTTGELAKMCDVTVRTVQYYDKIELLTPSELSDGGRRLYNDEDYQKLMLINMLKSMSISLSNIKEILNNDDSKKVLALILAEQKLIIQEEIEQKNNQLNVINTLQYGLDNNLPVKTNKDIAFIMENRKELKKTRVNLTLMAIFIGVFQWGSILWWIFKGNYVPYLIILPFRIIAAIFLIKYYYRRTAYVCPECNTKFKPKLKEFTFAKHTLTTRKLICPNCATKGFCLEVYSGNN
ncbi:MAG: MerR family transcriptional regulator [Christensenellaceae bacterium]|nr:MerR family transcriptional regulator [Christensenellaceae bacterium]